MSTYYFVGSGIASLAGAAYLIRDGGVAGHEVMILEDSEKFGGALDALLRFIHHFANIDTQEGVYRTRYSQYDSMAVPLVRWLEQHGVEMRFATRVENLGFAAAGKEITVNSIACSEFGVQKTIAVADTDCVFVTNGSMTAGKAFGSMSTVAKLDRTKRSGAWQLWETLAQSRPQFGNPSAFDDHIEESVWESFTVTVSDPLFFDLMRKFSGGRLLEAQRYLDVSRWHVRSREVVGRFGFCSEVLVAVKR